jgi:predicted RNase H-like HicB family nuclease
MGAEKTLRRILSGTADAAMIKYEVIIYWSEEDQAFVAEVPELPGCTAHGGTQEAALGNALDAIRLWVDTAKEFGDPIPEPKGRRLIFA